MIQARIVVEPVTLRPGRLGSATGVIWLLIGEMAFPTADWNDSVVVVLGWWAKAALQLMRGISKREEVNFIDGPYQVRLAIRSADEWEIRLFATGPTCTPSGRAVVNPRALVDSIIAAAGALLTACRTMNCWSVEADVLERLEASLRKAAGRPLN
jgi:hypothetical protein